MVVIEELKRRRVFRAIVAYGVFSFALLQVIEPLMHGLHLPDSTLTVAVIALGFGFPVVVVLSWGFDLTRGVLERVAPPPPSAHPWLRGARLAVLLSAIGVLSAAPGIVIYMLAVRRAPAPEVPPEPTGPSIAVLPFADLSAGRDQEYFSDGLAEEILDALAHVEGLRVTGRTSSFSFKGKNEDAQSIAQKLHVTTLLEGSVRREGTRLRITAQLINAADGFHLWSQTFDRQVAGIFAVQEEISAAVVQALRVKLLPGRVLPAPQARKTTPEAYALYLIALQLLNRGSADNFRRAIDAYEKALALDEGYAPAWAGLALATFYASNVAGKPAEVQALIRRATAAAERAVTLGPDLAETWAARGYLRALVEWNWEGAMSDLHRALAINGGDAQGLRRYALVLATLGRLPEAIAATRRSAGLDPLAAEVWDNLGYLSTASGDLAGARAASARALEIAPEQSYAANHAAVADLLDGRAAQALQGFERTGEEIFRLQGVAMAQHELGHEVQAKRALDQLIAKYAHNSAFQIAQAHAFRGEADAAFTWLERAYEQRDGGLSLLKCDPLLAKIRPDPRYAALLRKLRLPR